jgi:hypothetical protein
MAASTVVMALPFESAEASRGGDARTGDFESDASGNEGNFTEDGNADSGATGGDGGDDTSTD